MSHFTAFAGVHRLAQGPLCEVAIAALESPPVVGPVLVFDDASGGVIDLDLSGTEADVRARYTITQEPEDSRGPGRPKLGVVAREVTLLPRHWDWLSHQPGGASAALRRLVDAARKHGEQAERGRQARERAYRFLHAVGGDLPGFEALSRVLFTGDQAGFAEQLQSWPAAIAAHALRLAEVDFGAQG